jgi:hypothetical protein
MVIRRVLPLLPARLIEPLWVEFAAPRTRRAGARQRLRTHTGSGLHLVAARANDHDSPLLEPTLAGICDMVGPLPERPCRHLDRGYDSRKTRDLLDILGYHGEIAVKGVPSPIQVGERWPVERTTRG